MASVPCNKLQKESLKPNHRPRMKSETILYNTILYYTILYYTILYYTRLYYTRLYCAVLYYTILYSTVLYNTIQYYTIQYNAIQYNTMDRENGWWQNDKMMTAILMHISTDYHRCTLWERAPVLTGNQRCPSLVRHTAEYVLYCSFLINTRPIIEQCADRTGTIEEAHVTLTFNGNRRSLS